MTGLKETLALKGIAKNRYGSKFRQFDPCSVNACSMLKQDFSSVFVSDRNRTTKLVMNRSADMSTANRRRFRVVRRGARATVAPFPFEFAVCSMFVICRTGDKV